MLFSLSGPTLLLIRANMGKDVSSTLGFGDSQNERFSLSFMHNDFGMYGVFF